MNLLENYSRFRFEREGRILVVTITGNAVNAVDAAMHDELARLFIELQADPDSDLIVLTGQGRAFCAGGDFDWFDEQIANPAKFRAIAHDAKRIVGTLQDLEKPIICRLNGAAAGLGATIALLCDVIIADENARIGDPHVKVGLVAGDGGAVIWPQLIGFARAKGLLMTGDLVPAREAVAMGLINYAVPTAELDTKVDEIAGKILANQERTQLVGQSITRRALDRSDDRCRRDRPDQDRSAGDVRADGAELGTRPQVPYRRDVA